MTIALGWIGDKFLIVKLDACKGLIRLAGHDSEISNEGVVKIKSPKTLTKQKPIIGGGRAVAPGPVPLPREFGRALETLKMVVGQPRRLTVLLTLAEGERSVKELASASRRSPPVIGYDLALLRHGSLVQARREGRRNVYYVTEAGRDLARSLAETLKSPTVAQAASISKSLLEDVGGFVDDPEKWFHTPNPEFQGRKPIDLIGTSEEPRLRNRIAAAKLGMFS